MICKIQVVTVSEDGRKERREITSIQQTDVKPETLGLTLAEGKMILKDLQQVAVESQVSSLLLPTPAGLVSSNDAIDSIEPDCQRASVKGKINTSCARACSRIWSGSSGTCGMAMCFKR